MSETYLCGCDVKAKENYTSATQTNNEQILVMGRSFDAEGFQICPEHGVRIKNWATPMTQTANGPRLDHSKAYPVRGKLRFDKEDTPDLRFNDDPTEFGEKILAGIHAERNGHGNAYS